MAQDPDELFDVVDAEDRVVGRLPRREVHRQRLRHRAVHILVINAAGRVFLHLRSRTKDLLPGLWNSSAAGHVGAGEEYDATAVRELAEELGCRPVQPLEPLFKAAACEETGDEFVWVYRARAEGPFQLDPGEIEEGRWLAPEEIDRWITERPQELSPSFRHLWQRARPLL